MFKKTTIEPQEKSSAVMASATRKAPEPRSMSATTSATTAPPAPAAEVTRDAIAKLAFQKWQKRGCPNGEDQRDWYEAERELKTSQAGRTRRSEAVR